MSPVDLALSASTLFRAVLAHVLESSLAGLAVLGIILACRRAPASLRRTLGWLGLIKFALPAAAFVPVVGVAELLAERFTERSPRALVAELPGYRFLAAGGPARFANSPLLIFCVLGVWALVTLVLLVRWAARSREFRRAVLVGAGQPSGRLEQSLREIGARVGLDASRIAVVPSESEGPGILGFRSPLLVIPRTLEASLTPREFDTILLHELVHLKRRDHLWGTIRTLFLSVYWYNPVVWLLCRSLALETERSCDEEVIRITGTPQVYADGILKTVRHSLGLFYRSLTGAAGHSISLRIKSILSPNPRIVSPIMKTLALCAACLVAILSVYADASGGATTTPGPKDVAGDTYDISKLDVYPKVLSQVRPVYPPDLHAQGVGGEVLVDFIVDTTGAVQNAFAARSSNPEFIMSALDSVNQWKFSPGKVAGKNVNTHMQVPIVYTLTADAPAPKS